jgi:hypothetical protein
MSDNLNPQQFGISPREEREMQGRAIGEHIYDSLEMAMTGEKGGFKAASSARAWGKMRDFPPHMIKEDEEGNPVAHHTTGNWTSTWHGGGMIDHTHKTHGTVDVTNLTDYSNPEHGPFGPGPTLTPEEFKAHHNDFVKYAKTEYPKEYQ